MTDFIGQTFPSNWLWSKYENICIESIRSQINLKFAHQKNLLINLTWFGPQFDYPDNAYSKFLEYDKKVDNLFVLATVDPSMLDTTQLKFIVNRLGNPCLYKLGNFDGKYQFNFFAPVMVDHFRKYSNEELFLQEPRWHFINYNRKPRQHRVKFVKRLKEDGLDKYGLVTLGKPDRTYDQDPDNTLFLTLGEDSKDYIKYGHWFDPNKEDDDVGIPHDVLSLHNINYWQHHFLHIVGATEFSTNVDLFVSETQFKPIIGLRPFLINGNPKTYQWLEDQGFKTFNRYFPNIDFNNANKVHESLIDAIKQIIKYSSIDIMSMYQDMLPDLLHNQKRFYEFAQEQKFKLNNLL